MKRSNSKLLMALLSMILILSMIPVTVLAADDTCIHSLYFIKPIDATCTVGGKSGSVVCKKCDAVLQEAVDTDPLGHDFVDGACTRCGVEGTAPAPTPTPTPPPTVSPEVSPEVTPDVPPVETPAPPTAVTSFVDVIKGNYYYDSVMWAASEGITQGYSGARFLPDELCSRAHIVTFLWRAYGCPAPTSTENPFSDVSKDAYYYDAVLWAVEKGIAMGTAQNKFSPNSPCTRAHVVTFLWRAEGRPVPLVTDLEFYDNLIGTYHFTAVLWAAKQGITDGVDANHFAPYQNCTRAHIVTFLYRAMAN